MVTTLLLPRHQIQLIICLMIETVLKNSALHLKCLMEHKKNKKSQKRAYWKRELPLQKLLSKKKIWVELLVNKKTKEDLKVVSILLVKNAEMFSSMGRHLVVICRGNTLDNLQLLTKKSKDEKKESLNVSYYILQS